VPAKRQLTFSGLHGVLSQKIVLILTTAVKTASAPHNLFLESHVSLENTPILSQSSIGAVDNKDVLRGDNVKWFILYSNRTLRELTSVLQLRTV
jgi:hypothetical protein